MAIKKLRVGVVGVGHIGSNHARLYAEIPSAEFAAVYDVDLVRGNAIGRNLTRRQQNRSMSLLTWLTRLQ